MIFLTRPVWCCMYSTYGTRLNSEVVPLKRGVSVYGHVTLLRLIRLGINLRNHVRPIYKLLKKKRKKPHAPTLKNLYYNVNVCMVRTADRCPLKRGAR